MVRIIRVPHIVGDVRAVVHGSDHDCVAFILESLITDHEARELESDPSWLPALASGDTSVLDRIRHAA